jgi:putative intracellular protease/amidase
VKNKTLWLIIIALMSINLSAAKVLIVVTNHSELGDSGKKTGYYLPEVTHPYFKFVEAGHEVDFASPLGGKAPMDEKSRDLSDSYNKKFLDNPNLIGQLDKTIALSKIKPKDYQAIVFAGGHGTMWDFRSSKVIKNLTREIYEKGGIVAAVCHGPAALLDVALSNGQYLLKNRKVTGFTNEEEEIVKLTKTMPFLLETKMREQGATFLKADPWQEKVVTDQRVVTGQNPASASKLALEVIKLIKK